MGVDSGIQKLIDGMSLEQKVGQMLVFGFSGTYPHPDILDAVERYHVAGFRVTPQGRKFHRYFGPGHPGTPRVVRPPEPRERLYGANIAPRRVSAEEYAEVLNTIRRRSIETGAGIPVYFVLDYEGDQNANFFPDSFVGFPHPMGLAAAGDPGLCRRVAYTVGAQLKAVGIDWLHSPVLDVNTHPGNPEIGARSYSPHAETVIEYARESLAGFMEAHVVATGKHFPGRGASEADVHFAVARIEQSRERMMEVHCAPYVALIEEGLPAIMLAHSIYPALDATEEIATVSRAIVTDLLRDEMGFEGVVMTDSFTMGGLMARYEVGDAAVRSIEAGVDLILLKDENALRGEVFQCLVDAVREERLSEERVNDAVGRVLSVKKRFGLLDGARGVVDTGSIAPRLDSHDRTSVAEEAAYKSIVVPRDRDGLLPLRKGARIAVFEECVGLMRTVNSEQAYCGALYEALLAQGMDAVLVDFEASRFEDAWPSMQLRAQEVDYIVHTGFFGRGVGHDHEIHGRIASLGTPTVFVTNNPYPMAVHPAISTVLVTFSAFAVSMRQVAAIVTGAREAVGRLEFDPERLYA